MSKNVAPDCVRIHFDAPRELAELIRLEASKGAPISVAEWCRRLAAWKVGYALPPERERRASKVRLTGAPKLRTGPKPKGVPCV